jgi:hypothetical protein
VRNEDQRLTFADFLDRLARDVEGPDEWFDLVVTHYHDEGLKEMRRRLVRLAIERDPRGSPVWLESDREQIRGWAGQLLDADYAFY